MIISVHSNVSCDIAIDNYLCLYWKGVGRIFQGIYGLGAFTLAEKRYSNKENALTQIIVILFMRNIFVYFIAKLPNPMMSNT